MLLSSVLFTSLTLLRTFDTGAVQHSIVPSTDYGYTTYQLGAYSRVSDDYYSHIRYHYVNGYAGNFIDEFNLQLFDEENYTNNLMFDISVTHPTTSTVNLYVTCQVFAYSKYNFTYCFGFDGYIADIDGNEVPLNYLSNTQYFFPNIQPQVVCNQTYNLSEHDNTVLDIDVFFQLIPEYEFDKYTTEYGAGYADGYNQGAQDSYDNGYNNGYADGYDTGSSNGYAEGYQTGNTQGYSNGYNTALSTHSFSFTNLFASISDTPILMIRRLFGFQLFGTSLISVFMSLFTALIVIHVIKKVF